MSLVQNIRPSNHSLENLVQVIKPNERGYVHTEIAGV